VNKLTFLSTGDQMKTTKYGLLYKGKLLGFSTSENSEDSESVPVTFELDEYSDNVWMVDSAEHAEWVRNNSTKWYNAGYRTPKNQYQVTELKVAKIIQEVEEVEVEIPSFKDVMLFLDEIGNETGHSYFIDNPDYEQKYSLYSLQDYLRGRK
jgi:hypothetical protein